MRFSGFQCFRPTIIRTFDPRSRGLTEEIFGPVLTVCVYEGGRERFHQRQADRGGRRAAAFRQENFLPPKDPFDPCVAEG
jgi:acyl-CoA reductase-like NAD-dependent aldehyde dehydrogenase